MRKIIFALAATLPAFGAAHADDVFSTLQFPEGKTISSRHQHGDAAPRSVIANPKRGMGISSAAPMETNPQRGKISSRYVYGDAPLPSTAPNGMSGYGLSSGAPMRTHGPSELGFSPRILDGSN
ncbi:hypothetical protein EET67_24005 [Pseudaminobacter arsenicus]|uniref:Uncharacterized protein n=1 Tax=Borborobacter arsenicus TaxID=1851146 RepID=A0A432UZF4_9HYPH|nr:hypothetical protein [Pseudaminobacter arsenicus]RUM95306.1 hypothetical protein EET67_24005 [Pseudaminobacter arsenicus]